jgi:hypothetical protein
MRPIVIPAAPAAEREGGKVSGTSLQAFAVVALPRAGGGWWRAFCGDSRGLICARADRSMPGVQDGRCPGTCEGLR